MAGAEYGCHAHSTAQQLSWHWLVRLFALHLYYRNHTYRIEVAHDGIQTVQTMENLLIQIHLALC